MEVVQTKKEMLNYKNLLSVVEKDYERVYDIMKSYASDITFLKEGKLFNNDRSIANNQFTIESDNFEKQINDYKKANSISSSFVEQLEAQNEALKAYIDKIIKGLLQSRRGLIEKQSPMNIINMQTQKARHELNANYLNMSTTLFRDNLVNAATITELSGINKDIVKKVKAQSIMAVPTFEKEIQVQFDKVEVQTQDIETDMKDEHIDEKKIKLRI